MNDDNIDGIKIYCNLLEELKIRLKSMKNIIESDATFFGHKNFSDEYLFLQLRKILEIIAFGSMCSNINLYKNTYDKYANHWRAKDILKKLYAINKNFYPIPIRHYGDPAFPAANGEAASVLRNMQSGFLTQDDFIFLYDICSHVIHSPNPYAEIKTRDLKLSINEWINRIFELLLFHQISLVGSNTSWIVYLQHPETGKSHAMKVERIKKN